MQANNLDFDAALGIVTRGGTEKRLGGVPRLIFERLLAERGSRGAFGYVRFADLRRALNAEAADESCGEADISVGIKNLRATLLSLDIGIMHREGSGYRLFVAPASGRAERESYRGSAVPKTASHFSGGPDADVAQRVADSGVQMSTLAEHVSDEAHRATQSAERITARIEELMARASRGAAALARELAGTP